MAQQKPILKFEGDTCEVTWDGRLCIHVEECVRAKGDLFAKGRKPWCAPETAEAAEIGEVVERCPTGALSVRHGDGSEETAPGRNRITVANDGPLYFHGDLEIDGATDDMPGVRFRAALCRCGASENKPFCDGSHIGVEFHDAGAVGDVGEGLDGPAPTGTVTVKRASNGPLLLAGDIEIVAGSGRVAWRGKKCALCRCGASGNKPFCDGSHRDAGFEAE